MKRENLAAGGVLLACAVLIAVQSLKLRYYTPLGPGPGFFPLWLSIAMAACSIGLIVQTLRGKFESTGESIWPEREGWIKLLSVLGALVATVLLLEPLGYRITMLVVYAFLLHVLYRGHYVALVLVSTLGSFGLYYLFELLQVPLPAGPFAP